MRRVVLLTLAAALSAPAADVMMAQDKAADVLKEMRAALGGDKLASMKALSVEGPFRRDMGGRQMEGTMALTFEMPGKFHKSEENELPGGMSFEIINVLADDKAWNDSQQRGGMGGGARMEIRMAGPGQGGELNPQAAEQARYNNMKAEQTRWLMAFFGAATLEPKWVAVAEAPDGKADVLELKDARGMTVRMFVDQQTHLPLMIQYQGIRPRVMINDGGRGRGGPGRGGFGGRGADAGGGGAAGGGGGSDVPPPPPPPPGGGAGGGDGRGGRQMDPAAREEMQRRLAAMPPPQPTTFTMYFADYKKVDGVMIPHRISQSADNTTVEEWEIKKLKVNPPIKAEMFEKK